MTKERLLTWCRWVAYTLLTLMVLVSLTIASYLWLSATKTSGEIKLSGLSQDVIVKRDAVGFVTIEAQSEADAYFSMGYVDAQDRLYQMVLLRQLFSGRLSEWMGPKSIEIDEYMRFLGFRRQAKVMVQNKVLSDENLAAMNQYSAGVNAFINTGWVPPSLRLVAGAKIEPWTAEDCVLIQKMLTWNLTNNWRDKYANAAIGLNLGKDNINVLFPESQLMNHEDGLTTVSQSDYSNEIEASKQPLSERYGLADLLDKPTKQRFDAFMAFEEQVLSRMGDDRTRAGGSNIWAVTGDKTLSGHPQMANDPHLSFKAPNLFHLVSLKWNDHVLSGVNVPGAPIMIIGQNEHIAWGFTNAHGDQSDLFYCDNNCPAKVDVVKEIIKVKGQSDHVYEVSEVRLFDDESFDGVTARVLPDSSGKAFLAWVGFEANDTTLNDLYQLNHAKSFESIVGSQLSTWLTPSQNIMIIGKGKYNVYYQLLGHIPERRHSGQLPINLDDPDGAEWTGWIVNPSAKGGENRSTIINTNNFIAPSNYPYLINGLPFDTARQQRAEDLIHSKPTVAPADHQQWQLDVRANEWLILSAQLPKGLDEPISGSRWLSLIESSVNQTNNPVEKKALEMMQQWHKQPKMSAESSAATLFAVWSRLVVGDVYQALELKMVDEPVKRLIAYSPYYVSNVFAGDEPSQALLGDLFKNDGVDGFLYKRFSKAVSELSAAFGDDVEKDWHWDKVHQINFQNALGKNPVLKPLVNRVMPIEGGRDTLNRIRWYRQESPEDSLLFDAKDGASVRMVVDGSDFNKTQWIMPMGQSDHVFTSKHYDDLNDLWARGQLESFISPNRPIAATLTLKAI